MLQAWVSEVGGRVALALNFESSKKMLFSEFRVGKKISPLLTPLEKF